MNIFIKLETFIKLQEVLNYIVSSNNNFTDIWEVYIEPSFNILAYFYFLNNLNVDTKFKYNRYILNIFFINT